MTDPMTGEFQPAARAGTRPLALASPGEQVEIVDLRGGDALARRLAAMGLRPGTRCHVLHNTHPGLLVVRVGESRIALGVGMAHKILVVRGS